MKRHKCRICKSKRLEKFMKVDKRLLDNHWKLERFSWECADDFCGYAMEKQYGLSSPLISRKIEDNPGVKNVLENKQQRIY